LGDTVLAFHFSTHHLEPISAAVLAPVISTPHYITVTSACCYYVTDFKWNKI